MLQYHIRIDTRLSPSVFIFHRSEGRAWERGHNCHLSPSISLSVSFISLYLSICLLSISLYLTIYLHLLSLLIFYHLSQHLSHLLSSQGWLKSWWNSCNKRARNWTSLDTSTTFKSRRRETLLRLAQTLMRRQVHPRGCLSHRRMYTLLSWLPVLYCHHLNNEVGTPYNVMGGAYINMCMQAQKKYWKWWSGIGTIVAIIALATTLFSQ